MDLHRLTPAAACLTIVCTLAACQGRPARQPTYSISVSGAGNQVIATTTGSESLFEVRSETGLGSADVEQTSGASPATIRIRLYLKGLEEFAFEYGETVVVVSVSSHGDQTVSESMRTAASVDVPIGPGSPYSMPVRVVPGADSGGGSTTGYIEVLAPQDYIQGNHRAFSMRWIDFYR